MSPKARWTSIAAAVSVAAALLAAVACGQVAGAVDSLSKSPITALLARGNAFALIP